MNRESTSLPDLGDLAPASDEKVRSVTNTVRGLAEVRLGTGGEQVHAVVGLDPGLRSAKS